MGQTALCPQVDRWGERTNMPHTYSHTIQPRFPSCGAGNRTHTLPQCFPSCGAGNRTHKNSPSRKIVGPPTVQAMGCRQLDTQKLTIGEDGAAANSTGNESIQNTSSRKIVWSPIVQAMRRPTVLATGKQAMEANKTHPPGSEVPPGGCLHICTPHSLVCSATYEDGKSTSL